MHKINIVAVGGIKEKYWIDAINEYCKRLSRFAKVEIIEVAEFLENSKTNIEQIKRHECDNISKNLSGFVVAMDKSGKLISSEGLSELIDETFTNGAKTISFIIGGSHGLTDDMVKKANLVISFGKITYPHQLMRVILLEQIYRAETIIHNISYHK